MDRPLQSVEGVVDRLLQSVEGDVGQATAVSGGGWWTGYCCHWRWVVDRLLQSVEGVV